jgi:lipoprotein-releasing system permease protein
MPTVWTIALRFLREGRMQTLLIIAGVTVGVAVVVFITALVKGLQTSLVNRTLGTQAHIVVFPPEELAQPALDRDGNAIAARVEARAQRLRSIDQWESMMGTLAGAPGVTTVSPMVAGPGFASRGAATKAIAILGVDPERYRRIVAIDEDMLTGRFLVTGTSGPIGFELAKDLGVTAGDKIRLTTTDGREEVLTVTGTFDVGVKELNRRWVFTTMKLAQTLLDLPGGVTNIDMTVDDIFRADRIAAGLAADTGLRVESWMQTNAQLLAAFRNQNISTLTIRVFVTLIVALGIASVLVVSVVQKQKEIGILRAMGASRGAVLRVFLLQGALVALAGSVLGSALAMAMVNLFARLFRNADGTPIFSPEVDPALIVSTWLIALLTGALAALLPARRAARLDPVAAIRAG